MAGSEFQKILLWNQLEHFWGKYEFPKKSTLSFSLALKLFLFTSITVKWIEI